MTGAQTLGRAVAALALTLWPLASGCASKDDVERTQVSHAGDGACDRPYADSSPWNAPIGAAPAVDPRSDERVRTLGEELTSDPTQYTYPVYRAGPSASFESVAIEGWLSDVRAGGRRLVNVSGGSVDVPVPQEARAAAGSDGQLIVLDPATGDEWGFWQLRRDGDRWSATNGYHYNTRWSGVPPLSDGDSAFVSRGAGVPYLAGLVRPCEIERGRIDHALAFAYDSPSRAHVYPATKSDGNGNRDDLPEGARLQLDPSLDAAALGDGGCRGPCLTIARALQRYGMYVVDNSGRPKVMLEYEGTADWNGLVDERTAAPIPLRSFRVVEPPAPPTDAAGAAP